jgi:8-oxo-dGTP diphosphatase
MQTPSPIPVVCALIEDSAGRVLVAQRPAHKHLGLKWEFPGGKIEPGETAWAALDREIWEELGAKIVPAPAAETLPRCQSGQGRQLIELIPFIVRLSSASPAPRAREHSELRWENPADLAALDLAPADRILAGQWAARASPCPRGE